MSAVLADSLPKPFLCGWDVIKDPCIWLMFVSVELQQDSETSSKTFIFTQVVI
jgi:hypothetical protein